MKRECPSVPFAERAISRNYSLEGSAEWLTCGGWPVRGGLLVRLLRETTERNKNIYESQGTHEKQFDVISAHCPIHWMLTSVV